MERHHRNAVNHESEGRTGGETFLLANGSSGGWSVDIDEAPDGTEWTLQLENAQTYLVFRLPELSIISDALHFLQTGIRSHTNRRAWERPGDAGDFLLGRFGSASVSLRWDRGEGSRRCFLIIGHVAHSTLHLSLSEEDVRMIVAALQQVVADLPRVQSE
jgi:hypothetical protein